MEIAPKKKETRAMLENFIKQEFNYMINTFVPFKTYKVKEETLIE